MRCYRFFRLEARGSVVDARWADASGDEDAATLATEFGAGLRCEIWERDRLVGMTEPFGPGTPTFCPRWPTSPSPYAEDGTATMQSGVLPVSATSSPLGNDLKT
jgi:hypothetical protein